MPRSGAMRASRMRANRTGPAGISAAAADGSVRDARGSPFSSLLSKSVYLLSSPQRTRDERLLGSPQGA